MKADAPVEALPEAPRDEWQRLCEACPWATFFHTPDWMEVLLRHAPGLKAATRAFRLADGGLVVVPLMATPRAGGLLAGLQSQYGGKPGGILAEGELEPEVVEEILHRLLTPRAPRLTIIRGRHDPHDYPGTITRRSTHIVPLAPDIPPRERYRTSTKRNLRKAEESGVEVREATTPDDWQHLARLHQRSMERQQSAESLRPEYVTALSALSPGNCRLWLATVGEVPVSCALVLSFRHAATYFLGGMDYDYQEHRPNNLLFDRILEHARAAGIREFDLGGSLGLEGLERFKEGLGGERVEYTVHRLAHPALKRLFRPNRKGGHA